MYKKILIILILVLIMIPFSDAIFKREVYDFFGNDVRQKVNYSFFSVNNMDIFTSLNMTNGAVTNIFSLIFQGGQPITWNSDKYTIDIPTSLGNTIQVGQELTLITKNLEGSIIVEGQIVYSNGAQGEMVTVALADASDGTKIHNIGMVTISICNNNAACPITFFGEVHDLDTSAWVNGTELYLTADGSGNLTDTIPGFPNYNIHLGTVLRSHASTGIILFQPEVDYGDAPTFNEIGIIDTLFVGGDVTSQSINDTIDAKIAATAATYLPTSFALVVGTNDNGGTLINISTIDETYLEVGEQTGSPGFDLRVNFTNVTEFSLLETYELYSGGVVHEVHIDIQRCSNDAWDTLDMFNTQTVFTLKTHIALDAIYNCGGTVRTRFHHGTAGNPSHFFRLDSIQLIFTSGSVGSGIGGSGTTSFIPKFVDATSLGNSIMSDDTSAIIISGDFNVTNVQLNFFVSQNFTYNFGVYTCNNGTNILQSINVTLLNDAGCSITAVN